MDAALEALVRKRAKGCCEYCHFPESFAELPFQMDHVIARQHGGTTSAENLALACCFCNRHKGPNLSGMDPATQRVARLFDPRRQIWEEHFSWNGAFLAGNTEVGRATIQTLNINRPDAVAVRALLMEEGIYPV
jgi:5-methylcytosine-specific restriction endonuclease McrA